MAKVFLYDDTPWHSLDGHSFMLFFATRGKISPLVIPSTKLRGLRQTKNYKSHTKSLSYKKDIDIYTTNFETWKLKKINFAFSCFARF